MLAFSSHFSIYQPTEEAHLSINKINEWQNNNNGHYQ